MEHHSKQQPPQLPLRFFRWFCHPELRDSIEGDLMELYAERVTISGKRKADVKFIIDVMLLFRLGIIKPVNDYETLNHYGMYKNYLKVGWRNLVRNKVFSIINISGLSLGLTCSILIALWVQDEYNIDAFHENDDRIFAVTSREYSAGDFTYGGYDTPGLLGEELKKVFPEIEYSCNAAWTYYYTLAVGDKKMKLPGNFAGQDFFKIFSYPLILGTKETALKSPESIAISRTTAIELFGSPELAMDKSIRFENYKDLKVTAVFEDLRRNVSDKFDYMINWDFFVERNEWVKNWDNSGPATFVRLREHSDAASLIPKMQHFIRSYSNGYTDLNRLELSLQLFSEKYLHAMFKNGHPSGGRIEYVNLFSLVAIFILMMACINFMNLSSSRSLKRAKEIGVRKVNGALKKSLIYQFMMEAFLFTSIAVFFSIILLSLLLPQFNFLTGKQILSPFQDIKFWFGITVLTLITGIVSGSYPAFLLSSFKPISILKGNLKMNSPSGVWRKGLMVFQFALSMIFIVGMIVISRQVKFVQNKNLGYQKDNLIYLPLTGSIATNFELFKNESRQIPGVIEVSHITHRPIELENSTGSVQWQDKAPDIRPIFIEAAVGYDFIKTMQATLLQGRDFSEDFADSANYIINETALKVIGYKDPIGMPLTFWDVKGTIIGVVKDFHFNSLHVPIKPLILRLQRGTSWGVALIRIESDKTSGAISELESLHKKLNPDFIFAHQFADEEYAYLYKSEQIVKKLSRYFAFLAIFISCLGLLGLVIFTAEQRTKEVGIRKVLGATVSQIVTLLSKDFIKLIMISILVSSPIAYYVMNKWLEGFEYNVGIQWWIFGLAALGAVMITLLTVSIQAIKAAIANPVNSLKAE